MGRDAWVPDREPVTPRDADPGRGVLGPLYGPDVPLERLPAGLIADCGGDLRDAARHILGRPCTVTDWDADPGSRSFELHAVMPDGPEPAYLEGAHLSVYGLVGEVTASRAVSMPGIGERPVAERDLPPGSGHTMRLSEYWEPDTLLLRLAAAGLVRDLPKLDVLESVLREHEGALLGP